jgi:hypothetical protein
MAYVRVAVLLHEIVNLHNSLDGSGQLHSRFLYLRKKIASGGHWIQRWVGPTVGPQTLICGKSNCDSSVVHPHSLVTVRLTYSDSSLQRKRCRLQQFTPDTEYSETKCLVHTEMLSVVTLEISVGTAVMCNLARDWMVSHLHLLFVKVRHLRRVAQGKKWRRLSTCNSRAADLGESTRSDCWFESQLGNILIPRDLMTSN